LQQAVVLTSVITVLAWAVLSCGCCCSELLVVLLVVLLMVLQ
jgi:hypothetical protein